MEQTLAGLGKRVFLMHNVHEAAPVIFQTRWAMSYLRGPLTRSQIRTLVHGADGTPTAALPAGAPLPGPPTAPQTGFGATPPFYGPAAYSPAAPPPTARPVVSPDIRQLFLPMRRSIAANELVYRPRLIGTARVNFVDTRKGLEAEENLALLAAIEDGPVPVDWSEATTLALGHDELETEPAGPARFAELPPKAAAPKSYPRWKKTFTDWVYRNRRFELFKSPNTREISLPGESERDFRIRISERFREERDLQLEKIRKKYASKFNTLRERIRRAEATVMKEQEQAKGAKLQTMISLGTTLLSAMLGNKAISATTIGKATTAARGAGRASQQAQDVDRARENLDAYQAGLEELEAEFQAESERIRAELDPTTEELATITLKPRKTDIDVQLVDLAWAPYTRTPDGELVAAWIE